MNAATVTEPLRPTRASARALPRASDRTFLLVAGITVFAAALRFWRIGHQSFWFDEAYTAHESHLSYGQMFSLLQLKELTPPLYFSLVWAWAHVFGYSEAAMRSLSALVGIATVPAMYAAATKLISRRAGLVAAALAACNPLMIWYSQEARAYALLLLVATLSLVAFAYARLPPPTPRRLAAWVVAAGLTLATHYYGALLVVPEAAWLLWAHRRQGKVVLRRVVVAIAAVGAVGLALLPLALTQLRIGGWIVVWPLNLRLGQIGPQFVLGTGVPARTALKIAGAVGVLLALVALAVRANADERRGALLAGGLALAGFAISMVLLLAGTDEIITRNLIELLVPLMVLVAGGLGARRAGVLGLLGAAILCGVGLIGAISVATNPKFQRPDWRGVVRAIGVQPPAGTGRAVVVENYPQRMALSAYMPRLQFLSRRGTRVQEVDVISAQDYSPGVFCWWGSTCNVPLSRLDTAMRLPGFHPYGRVIRVRQFAILRLRSTRPVRITLGEVSRALTTTIVIADAVVVQPPH